jgi:hypothetical protein
VVVVAPLPVVVVVVVPALVVVVTVSPPQAPATNAITATRSHHRRLLVGLVMFLLVRTEMSAA